MLEWTPRGFPGRLRRSSGASSAAKIQISSPKSKCSRSATLWMLEYGLDQSVGGVNARLCRNFDPELFCCGASYWSDGSHSYTRERICPHYLREVLNRR